MKYYLASSDASGQVDANVTNQILAHFEQVGCENDAEITIVPISYYGNYRFNEDLKYIKKPVVLIEFVEFAWNWDQESENRFGHGMTHLYGHLNTPEYAKLDQWVRDNPPRIYFKRELKRSDASESVLPVEYLCYLPAVTVQTEAEFNARPIQVFNNWGYSHPSRRRLHGDIFRYADNHGIHIIDSWDQGEDYQGSRTWATIHTPHFLRRPIWGIQPWISRSKIAVSLPGAGNKCFRSSESSNGAIVALLNDKLAWGIDWIHGLNCIRLRAGFEFDGLQEGSQSILYDIYRNGQETIDRYRPNRYVAEYMIPAIRRIL